jgi:hypothetical protein
MQKTSEFIKLNFLKLKNNIKKKRFWILSLFVLFVTALFFADSLHESYPDEFDNISGGWLILHGDLIYKSFFTHHGPFPYFLSSFIEIFSGQSFVKFRVVYALFLVLVNFSIFAYFKFRVKEKIVDYYPFFIILLGFESTYYWSQMLLADNIAAYCFLFIYALLLLKVFYKKLFTFKDLVIVSVVGSIGFYSSLTFTYLYVIFILVYFSVFLKQYPLGINKKSLKLIFSCLFIFTFPHLVYFIYLIVTQTLHNYIFQNFTFNTKFYIYNYPRPSDSTTVNPIRYAILIVNNYFNHIYPLLMRIKDFDIFNPFNVTMAFGNLVLFFYLILKRYYKWAVLSLIILIFSTVRSNPSTSGETDYQSAVYIFISLFNIFFLLPNLFQDINDRAQDLAKKIIFAGFFIVLLIYSFGSSFGFFQSFSNRFFAKYMGTAPLIYDRPKIAPVMNVLLTKDDYTWVGPFNFEDDFYLNAKPASRYHILIPGLSKTSETRDQLILDLKKTNPKAIWFYKRMFILGNSVEVYGKFLTDYLKNDYVTILDYNNKSKIKYISTTPFENATDIETNLYLRKNYTQQGIDKLVNAGYLKVKD